jgi:hypothetical protein
VIELMTFDLAPGADEAAFLECNARLQTDFAYQQQGLLRRTVARGDGRSWIVIDLWASGQAAEACDQRWGSDPLAQEWMSHLDRDTVRIERWNEIG